MVVCYTWYEICIVYNHIIERNLEVKLPTIWTDEKAEVWRIREEKTPYLFVTFIPFAPSHHMTRVAVSPCRRVAVSLCRFVGLARATAIGPAPGGMLGRNRAPKSENRGHGYHSGVQQCATNFINVKQMVTKLIYKCYKHVKQVATMVATMVVTVVLYGPMG